MKRRAPTFKREPLTGDEANALRNAARTPEERLIVWGLLDTGLRVAELASLTRDAVDWQSRRLVLKGKGGRRRVVPLTPPVYELLGRHFAYADTFPGSVRTIQRTVAAAARRASIRRPVTPHVLRHTFAVTALQRGLSLPALQQLLGHSDLTTTAIYLNLSPEEAIREYRERYEGHQ
jgi:integrase/recombinase XerD